MKRDTHATSCAHRGLQHELASGRGGFQRTQAHSVPPELMEEQTTTWRHLGRGFAAVGRASPATHGV